MEWLIGIVSAVLAFMAGFMPVFGNEVRYRLPTSASIQRPSVTVLFGGDAMLDRSVRIAMEKEGEDFIFSCLGGTLRTPDLTVLNLEGPITENPSKSVGSAVGSVNNTKFTFASGTASLLKRQGVDIVSLANNHAQDFGRRVLWRSVRRGRPPYQEE
jgi:poly-gamma-glutamate capsule biosynthesis protein CapA/YwtB (metallophosphatase superfamily)